MVDNTEVQRNKEAQLERIFTINGSYCRVSGKTKKTKVYSVL